MSSTSYSNSTDYPAYGKPCPATYTSGCYEALAKQVQQKLLIVEIAALVIGSIEIVGLIFSAVLICYLPGKNEEKQALLRGAMVVNRDFA